MKCPFKTPAKYKMKITSTEYIVVDAERKVIAKCNYEDDALFIQNVINSHEKLLEAIEYAQGCGIMTEKVCKKFEQALKEAGER